MNYNTLKISHKDIIQRIQIYRPEADNSINTELNKELLLALQQADADQTLKVVVLEGLPNVFCTGMDLQEVKKGRSLDQKAIYSGYYNILKQMSQSSKVILSLVRGKVQAGGVGLVAASDIVIADERTTFVLPELLFGLIPACVLPFLIRKVGFQKAYRLGLTTQSISALEAYNWGLVDEYNPDPENILRQLLRRLKCLPLSGLKTFKDYTNQLWTIEEKTQDLAVNTISSLVNDPDIQEKIERYVNEGILPWQT